MTTVEGKNSMFSSTTRASSPIALFACLLFASDVSYAADGRSAVQDLELLAGEVPGVGGAEDGTRVDGVEEIVEEIVEDLDVEEIDDLLDDPRYLDRIRRLELSGEYLRWLIHNGGY